MSSSKKNSKRDGDTAGKPATDTNPQTTPASGDKPEAGKKPETSAKAESGATTEGSAKPATSAKPEAAKPEADKATAKSAASKSAETSQAADSAKSSDTAAKTTPEAGKSASAEGPKDAQSQHRQNTDVKPTSQNEGTTLPAPTPPAPESGGGAGFGTMFFGGVTCALIGAFAAYMLLPQLGLLPDQNGEVITRLEAETAAQEDQISTLSQRVEELSAANTPQVSSDQISDIEAQLSALGDRLASVEDMAQNAAPAGDTVSTAELQKLREEMDTLLAEAVRKDDQSRTTLRRAALTRVRTALDNGSPLDDALANLAETGQEIPSGLNAIADTGAPTLAALQSAFPDAAREALQAARQADPEANAGSGMLGFLNSQLGVRSLEPREGGDPDAILSRAEARLRDGDLAATLEELDALPDSAKAEISGWIDQAQTRLTATQAADELGAQLN
ncbi:mitofilin family membrane protein [Roseovarius sp. C7]|uniref:COG4223 family protein n=1 Tax=Roseovarius sp. C7 TaxID=3398643 RepID=UPI0039F6F558